VRSCRTALARARKLSDPLPTLSSRLELLRPYASSRALFALPARSPERRSVLVALAAECKRLRVNGQYQEADGAYLLVALLLSDSLVWLAGCYRADSGEIFEALLFAIDQEAAVMASVVRTLLSNARRAVAMRGLRLFIDGEIEAKHLSQRATVEELFLVNQISHILTLEEQELVVRAWVLEEKQAELAKELGYAVGSLRVILCRIRVKILKHAA
jgi:hypothetical protein